MSRNTGILLTLDFLVGLFGVLVVLGLPLPFRFTCIATTQSPNQLSAGLQDVLIWPAILRDVPSPQQTFPAYVNIWNGTLEMARKCNALLKVAKRISGWGLLSSHIWAESIQLSKQLLPAECLVIIPTILMMEMGMIMAQTMQNLLKLGRVSQTKKMEMDSWQT